MSLPKSHSEQEMTSQQPNTFLSRVFGVNSTFPDGDTELSSIRDEYHSDDPSQRLVGDGTHSKNTQTHRRSIIESDQDSDSDYDHHSIDLHSHNDLHRDLNEISEDSQEEDEEAEGDKDDEVPLSIMVHGTETTKPQEKRSKVSRLTGLLAQRSKSPFDIENQAAPLLKGTNEPPNDHISFKRELKKPVSSSPFQSEEERVRRAKLGILNPKERALWKWANIENLDKFLQEVYSYYLGSGYYCIMMTKIFDLATLAFIVFFSTYLTSCIDYSKLKLPATKSLEDVKVDQCYANIGAGWKLGLWLFYIYFVLKVVQVYFDAKQINEIHLFYKHLLEISDTDLQTISWQVVVLRIMLLKDQNAITSNVPDTKSKSRIDAHDIANRIMRKENYYIALFNKDILDLTLPIPWYKENILTRTLEWNLQLCISGFVFNEAGQIRQQFLKESKRRELSQDLKKRFMLAGVLNIILSPLLVAYFLLLYFFRYFNEYRKNPGSIGSRQYTPLAEWKFREFNELYHLFQRRLNLSVPEASKYVDQFPKEKTVLFLKFVAFISGSFAAVLGMLSIFDPDMFFNFEITKDRTVLFYISIFGTIWAICHGAIPEEYQVYDSEASLRKVAEYTHYLPPHWEGKYHTDEVRVEFCEYFALKPVLLLREIASLVLTPFILWFSLPNSSDKIVDFFREYSVHVDGLGYVCTFAMFNFEKANTKKKEQDNKRARGAYHRSSEDKMLKSYLYFLDSYGHNQNMQRNGSSPQKHRQAPHMSRSLHQPSQRLANNAEIDEPGAQSFLFDQASHPKGRLAKLRGRQPFHFDQHQPLGDSYITTLPKTDLNEIEADIGKEPGVLGMVNQFYKDYQISH